MTRNAKRFWQVALVCAIAFAAQSPTRAWGTGNEGDDDESASGGATGCAVCVKACNRVEEACGKYCSGQIVNHECTETPCTGKKGGTFAFRGDCTMS